MNKKGFTLIELLAVIVILAVIALIATPIVLNIIKDSRESAGLRSAEMYLKGVETSVASATINNKKVEDGTYPIMPEGDVCLVALTENKCDKDNTLAVEMNGEKPESGSITIESGKITDIELTYSNGKTIVKNDGKLVYGEKEETEESKTFEDICTYVSGTVQTAGSKYSCEVKEGTSYNFYVLTTPEEGVETINLIMDRNICEDGTLTDASKEDKCTVAWLSKDDYINNDGPNTEQFTDGGPCQYGGLCSMNEFGPITAMTYLNKATSTWKNIDNLNLTYDDEGTLFTGFKLNGKARLPYESEVSDYDSTNKTNAYLYDNLATDGTSTLWGYWTLSSSTGGSGYARYVSSSGYVGGDLVSYGNRYGVRPVITLKLQ